MRRGLVILSLIIATAISAAACSGSDDDGGGPENSGSPTGSALATQPPVSATGGTDAFLIYREASGNLIAHNLASGDRYRQTVDFNTEVVVNVQCTRDGSRLAYLRQLFGEEDRKLDIHGEDPTTEPISIPNTVQGIAWSPDGDQMALATYDGFALVHSLSILDLGTGESTELSTGEDFAGSIAWSPDGETLAYYLQKLEEATTHVYTLPVDGGEPTQVTQDDDSTATPGDDGTVAAQTAWYDPDWSADGDTLLVAGINQEDFQLYEVEVESGARRQITESNIFKRGARFSPDGTTIAYTGSIVEPQVSAVAASLHSFAIFLMNSDGTDERAFTADPRENPGANVDPNLDAYFLAWCAPGPWLDDLWTPEQAGDVATPGQTSDVGTPEQ